MIFLGLLTTLGAASCQVVAFYYWAQMGSIFIGYQKVKYLNVLDLLDNSTNKSN